MTILVRDRVLQRAKDDNEEFDEVPEPLHVSRHEFQWLHTYRRYRTDKSDSFPEGKNASRNHDRVKWSSDTK